MKIILDANILIAALLGSQKTITTLSSLSHIFYAPRKIIDEVKKYKILICEKSGQSAEEFDAVFEALLIFVHIVDRSYYLDYLDTTKSALYERDPKDVDYIACAKAIHADFLWTNDKDFSAQREIKTKTTQQIIEENI